MSIATTATVDEYDELMDSLAPIRYAPLVGSSAPEAGVRRWTRHLAADTTIISFLGEFDFRPGLTSEQDTEMFLRLFEQWHVERIGAASSMAEIIACPSYLRIISMGWRALPLIIEQLEREGDEPDHWCAALEAVTGEDPVPEDAHGDTVRIAQAWIAWNRTRVAWSFPTSTTPTIESPAIRLAATTASPGLLKTM